METHEAMRELCTILGIGSIIPVSTEDIVARVRNLAAQSAEAHTRLDDAGVVKPLDLPVRVGLLRKEVRRALDGWALANARLDQSNEEVVAARGDLRVERERADMLDKARLTALEGCNEAQKRWEAVVAERDTLAARVKELEGRPRGLGIIIPAGVDLVDMLRKHAKAYIVFEKRDGSGTKILLKDNNALGWNGTKERSIDFPPPSTAVNPSKPGLQPMKCPCGGKIEFGRERVGHCLNCGASCRVMDPPPATGDEVDTKGGQSLTAALVEANRNTVKWRTRAQKCQQALRRIRAEVRVDVSYLDEDWGGDADREV